MDSPKVVYKYSRLCFKAALIELLGKHDCFRIETPDGEYQMTKAQFYEFFSNVVVTKSYRKAGIYHYPRTPKKAEQFKIAR